MYIRWCCIVSVDVFLISSAKDTLANITTPTEFYKNVMAFLNALPPRLPPGSHVVLVALVDGSFIYDAMSERYHPIGNLYLDFNCLFVLF